LNYVVGTGTTVTKTVEIPSGSINGQIEYLLGGYTYDTDRVSLVVKDQNGNVLMNRPAASYPSSGTYFLDDIDLDGVTELTVTGQSVRVSGSNCDAWIPYVNVMFEKIISDSKSNDLTQKINIVENSEEFTIAELDILIDGE
jgi:hypothetical protein